MGLPCKMQQNWTPKEPFFVTSSLSPKTFRKDNYKRINKKLVICLAGRVFAFYRLKSPAARFILANG